ncbi:hypothetical protein DENSPDRAFT_741482, partial [Dentipellis sp. KUC8613]
KPRDKPKPYIRKEQSGPKPKDAPQTSAQSVKRAKENLTLHDWLTVIAYHDQHQPISQAEVVQYFATRAEGILVFNQSSLSRHLSNAGRKADQAKLASTPTALSAKRAHIVTRPDVEHALVQWIKHMEEKGEQVMGPMLKAKRERFEQQLEVLESERMKSTG